jgi:mannose-6-phosphate isomerase-like protein (cupin superfamily)
MSYPDARYLGDEGEISARYRPADQEPELMIGSSTAVRYLATGASTNGQFGLYRWEARPHTPGPSAHFHKTISESFFILSGTVRLFNGERWIDATAGDFLYVPEGGVHAFHNERQAGIDAASLRTRCTARDILRSTRQKSRRSSVQRR